MANVYAAQEPFSGTGNAVIKFSTGAESLVLINDGDADLTFKAGYFEFTLKAGEVFDEIVNPFSELTVTATGAYRGFVRDVKS